MRLRNPHGTKSRVSFPGAGTFEFDPEGEVPDEFPKAIEHLLADGYTEVGVTSAEIHEVVAQAKKGELGKVEIPTEPEKPVETAFVCPDCGKVSKTPQGLAGHKRFCKGKPE